VVDDDGDDTLASPMIRVARRMLSSSSFPSRFLLEMRFMRFSVALSVGSQVLHVVRVFEEAESMSHGTSVRYVRALPVPAVVKVTRASSHIVLSPKCVENHLNKFYHFKISF
jgi:hypothetical protein